MQKSFFFNLSSLLILLTLFSCKQETNSTISNPEKQETSTSTTLSSNFDFLPTSTSNVVVKYENYTLSYVEKYEQAEWVAYRLTEKNFSNRDYKRPYFIEDPLVKTESADWRNYKKSGYDKGHLCPAGDMKISEESYNDTFFTSNISPQKHDFNAGIWNNLEQKIRYWTEKYGEIYVITGGVLEPNLKTIGQEDVAVPNYFYKVLFCNQNGKSRMIAFLVPHENSKKPLYSFVVSVDELEKKTGVDFFPNLEDSIENPLEKNSSYKDWSF